MIMNRLNSELRGHAVSYGLCTQWQGDWQNNKSQQELIGMYIRGIDFCIEHDYPTVEYIKGNFDRSLLHQNHIFVDEPVKFDPDYVLSFGKYSGRKLVDVYKKHPDYVDWMEENIYRKDVLNQIKVMKESLKKNED